MCSKKTLLSTWPKLSYVIPIVTNGIFDSREVSINPMHVIFWLINEQRMHNVC